LKNSFFNPDILSGKDEYILAFLFLKVNGTDAKYDKVIKI